MFCGFEKQIGRKLSLTFRDYRESGTRNKAGICRLGNVDPKRLCSESTNIVAKRLAGEQLGSRNLMPGTES